MRNAGRSCLAGMGALRAETCPNLQPGGAGAQISGCWWSSGEHGGWLRNARRSSPRAAAGAPLAGTGASRKELPLPLPLLSSLLLTPAVSKASGPGQPESSLGRRTENGWSWSSGRISAGSAPSGKRLPFCGPVFSSSKREQQPHPLRKIFVRFE